MQIFFKYSFLIIVSINLASLFSTNYIHEELNGNLIGDGSLNFSLFINDFTGIVFYAIDEDKNRILIELEDQNYEKRIVFKFNEYFFYEKSKNLCGCLQCSDVYITITLQLEDNNIVIHCNNQTKMLKIKKSKIVTNQLTSYPIPKEFGRRNNRTFIWMGNIGYYVGKNGMEYQALKNQLIGCLDKLYFQGKLIAIKSNGSKLNSPCPTRYDETVCRNKICNNSIVSYKITDCSINVLNGRYCTKNLYPLNQSISNNIIKLNGEPIITRIEWVMNSITGIPHCLAEFTYNNGFEVIFYINSYQKLILTKGYFQSIAPKSKALKVLLPNITHTMIAYNKESEFIIKISSGEKINTFIFPVNSSLITIKIGVASKYGLCNEFQGLMDFQYEIRQQSHSKKWSTQFKKKFTSRNKYKADYTTVTEYILKKYNKTITDVEMKNNEVNAVTITLIASVIVLFFIFFLVIFYIVIKIEMRSNIKRIYSTPNNTIIRNTSQSRDIPLPNIYEYEDPIALKNHSSEYYEIVDD